MDVSEYYDFHCFAPLPSRSFKLFLCLVHNTADIAETSPPEGIPGLAFATAPLLLAHDFSQNGRCALIVQHILENILFGKSKAVADQVLFLWRFHMPAFFRIGVISS